LYKFIKSKEISVKHEQSLKEFNFLSGDASDLYLGPPVATRILAREKTCLMALTYTNEGLDALT
jgi:hypothetical protein